MANVYFKKIDSYTKTEEIQSGALELLKTVIDKEKIKLSETIPIKTHFGEKGNTTFIEPKNYEKVIDFLKEKKIKTFFIESSVLYGGERSIQVDHLKLAKEHGFNQIPVIIADGERGSEYEEVEINLKRFKKCKIGKEFTNHKQYILLNHFKGHDMAGFGGAIKQLAMGFASRAGKLEQHSDSYPLIIPLKCKKCNTCVVQCPEKAIKKGLIYHIQNSKCIGCGKCMTVCPHGAVLFNPFKISLASKFYEKIAEHAYASQLESNNIYINFALNITKSCDCMGKSMTPIIPDIGIFASTDPVSIDKACLDMAKTKHEKEFKGMLTIDYADEIGLGEKKYKLIEI